MSCILNDGDQDPYILTNGFDDAAWYKFQDDLKAYGIEEFLTIHQKYLDEYLKNA